MSVCMCSLRIAFIFVYIFHFSSQSVIFLGCFLFVGVWNSLRIRNRKKTVERSDTMWVRRLYSTCTQLCKSVAMWKCSLFIEFTPHAHAHIHTHRHTGARKYIDNANVIERTYTWVANVRMCWHFECDFQMRIVLSVCVFSENMRYPCANIGC